MRRQRSGQIIITTSFLTVLVMMTIAFVAYSAAIFNSKPYFDDYTAVSLNFRSSSEALTRHILANLTAYIRSQGTQLTTPQLKNYVNTVIVPLMNAYQTQFGTYAYSKSMSIGIVPPATFTSPAATLFNGTAVSWPGIYPATNSPLPKAYSIATYRYYLNITSDSLSGYSFTSTAMLSVNVTGTAKPDANTITISLQARNEADFELDLNLVSLKVHNTSTGWSDQTSNSGLFSYVNGTYSLTINVPSTNVDQVSFAVFDSRSVLVFMNSTV